MTLVSQRRSRNARGLNALVALLCAFLLTVSPTLAGFAPNCSPLPPEIEEKHTPLGTHHAERLKSQSVCHRLENPRIPIGRPLAGLTHPLQVCHQDTLLSCRLTPLRC